jgi:hypothetical protein
VFRVHAIDPCGRMRASSRRFALADVNRGAETSDGVMSARERR